MAKEFPHVDWIGTDLAPIQKNLDLQANLSFMEADCGKEWGFPDDHFNLVHARTLVAGVKNWKMVVQEAIRVTKPGGLIVFAESTANFHVNGCSLEENEVRAPGFAEWMKWQRIAFKNRGYDMEAAPKTIKKYLEESNLVRDINQQDSFFPLWEWSDDPYLHQSGLIARNNAIQMPDAIKMIMLDGAGISEEKFQELKSGWLAELGKPGCDVVCPLTHNWAWKSKA